MRNPTSTTAEKQKVKRLTPLQSKWLKALESGKYRQCKNRLKDGDSFCCLGVACEVVGLKANSDNSYSVGAERAITALPELAVRKLKLNDHLGRLTQAVEVRGKLRRQLTQLNDSAQLTFPKIAAFIRANKALVFRQD